MNMSYDEIIKKHPEVIEGVDAGDSESIIKYLKLSLGAKEVKR